MPYRLNDAIISEMESSPQWGLGGHSSLPQCRASSDLLTSHWRREQTEPVDFNESWLLEAQRRVI